MTRDELGERLAVDVLHRHERPAVILADVVDVHDVRMREPRGEARLAKKACAQLVVTREVLGEALQRDGASELDVANEVDDRHRAVPERALELVAARDHQSPPSSPCVLVPLAVPFALAFVSALRGRDDLRRRARDLRREVVDAARERFEQAPWDAVLVHGAHQLPLQSRDPRLRIAAVVRGERRCDRGRLLGPGVCDCPRQLRLHRLPLRGARAAAGERGRDRGEDGGSSHSPTSSRAASASGSPAARISACVRSTSYGTRRNVAVRASRSSTR